MANKIIFIIFLQLFFNLTYCLNNFDFNSKLIQKDTISTQFQVISIEKIKGYSLRKCTNCKLKNNKFTDTYYRDSLPQYYKYKQKGYMREAYLMEVLMINTNYIYQLISLEYPKKDKKKCTKIKIGGVYNLNVIRYYEYNIISDFREEFISIDGINFKVMITSANILIPLNIKGLYVCD
ncbi:MAG: hypothetical protein WAP17_04480 [Bacteroidales bacterium]